MLTVTNLEDFAYKQMFLPYTPSICGYGIHEAGAEVVRTEVKRALHSNVGWIMSILEKHPFARDAVFERLKEIGVQWYWAIDSENIELCKYVEENLQKIGYQMPRMRKAG